MLSNIPLEKVVDLSDAIPPTHELLSGENWGRQLRQQAELDRLDGEPTHVVIRFPDWVMSVTTSFIRGLLRDSVVRLGASEFSKKYRFDGQDFRDLIDDEVARGERSRQYREVA